MTIMTQPKITPIDIQVRDARGRAEPLPFRLQSTDITGLLVEAMQLAKLVATEERDLESIRTDFALRIREIDNSREKATMLISGEYKERSEQITLLNENVKLLIKMNQFDAAVLIMNRMADILADSPLKRAMPLK